VTYQGIKRGECGVTERRGKPFSAWKRYNLFRLPRSSTWPENLLIRYPVAKASAHDTVRDCTRYAAHLSHFD